MPKKTSSESVIKVNPDADTPESKPRRKKPEEWTILTAMNKELGEARETAHSQDFWKSCKKPLAFLTKKHGHTNIQVLFLSMLIDSGKPLGLGKFTHFLNCSRISHMQYTEDLDGLVEKRWALTRISDGQTLYAHPKGLTTALSHNQVFEPEAIEGLDIQEIMTTLVRYLDKTLEDMDCDFEACERWMLRLCKSNPLLPLCKTVLNHSEDIHVQSLLMMVAYDYAGYANTEYEGYSLSGLEGNYPEGFEADMMFAALRNGSHILMKEGRIELRTTDAPRVFLTSKRKEELLCGYKPEKKAKRANHRDLKSHTIIKEKPMF